MTRIARPLASSALALALVASPALAQTGNVANGQKLYFANGCYACHGTRGAGGGVAGPRISPPLPVEAFTNQLRKPIQRMPAFSEKLLTAAQIDDILAYLRTFPRGKTAAEIPLLRGD